MKVIAPGDIETDLGTVEESPTVGMIDYSRRVTDDFGVTTVVKRGFARRMDVRIGLPSENVSAVQRVLAALRATAARWVADDGFDWLNFVGFFKDFQLTHEVGTLSYCTLTVEGLAETEDGADAGEDAAPDGRPSTLLLLQPVTLTTGMLVSSNAPETDYPEWSNITVYPEGARVIKTATHRIYESVAATNVANDPAGVSGKWLDIGPTNRWAMFDQALGTMTSRASSIVVTVAPGAVNAVALLDVVGATVRVQGSGYDQTKAVGDGAVTFLDLPGAGGNITVTVAGSGTVSVGTMLVGSLVGLGVTGESPTAGITDFSRKEVDDFGEVTIVERAWAKRMEARALIRTDAIDDVANRIAMVRALPSLWIADEGTETLTLYGFFKDFSIAVAENVSTLSLSVEGLSEAMPIVEEDDDALAIVEKNIYRRSSTAPATPTGGSFDFDTMTTTPPADWSVGVPVGTDPVYISSAIASKVGGGGSADFGAWSPPVIAFINGEDGAAGSPGAPGAPGSNGLNNAVVYLYRRGATSPAGPSGTFTYTFATAALSGGTLNGWSQDIPAADGNPLWVIAASASSSSSTDGIPAAEFTAPVLKDGAGLNAATVFLYQRAASAPAVPAGTLTYTFATGGLAGTLGSWSRTAPDHDGNPLYMITATALGPDATDTIATGEWSAARVLATNGAAGTAGAPGAPGANGTTFYTWYGYADSLAPDYFNFSTGSPDGRAYQGIATGKTTPTESTNPADYIWSPYIGPPNFGLTAFNANAVVASNKLIKVAGGGAWNAGIHSTESYKGGASVTFLVDAGPHSFMVGLNTDPTTDANYTSIDFAIYIAGTTLQIYESGTFKFEVLSFVSVGDVFTVTYNGKNVYYSKNGVVFYTSLLVVPGDLTLFLDTSFLTSGVYFGKILAFVAVGAAGSDGSPGAPGSPGSPGVSPVAAVAVPASKQFTADSDGTIKAGQLPFNVAIDGIKAGAAIGGTVTILAVNGCTATAISGGFTIDTISADAGFVSWRFTATDSQIVEGKMSFSRQLDPVSGGQILFPFSSTSWWGSGSYGSTGPATVLPASSTGKLAIAGYASFYCSGNGEARLTAKLQYRAVGSGTWIDSGFTSGPSIAIKTADLPGEPGENSPGEVSPGGTLTGLTPNGSYEVQMVGLRNASYNAIASATGRITLRQVA